MNNRDLEIFSSKTQLMIFSKKYKNPHINCLVKLGETDILPSSIVRFLDIILNSKLSDEQHLAYVINKGKKLNSIISALRIT